MKKSIIAAGLLALFSTTAMANETLIVGATPVPHAEILEFVKPVLAKEGVDLQIKVFNDLVANPICSISPACWGATPACCTATASVSRAGSSASCRSG